MDALALLNQTTTPVQGFALFSDVSPSDCASIISAGREKHYRRKQTIFSEGEPVRQVVLLLSGFVKIKQLGLNGDEVILRVNGVGEIVGAFRLSVNYHHCSTAQAIQPSRAIVWSSATFGSYLSDSPPFAAIRFARWRSGCRRWSNAFEKFPPRRLAPASAANCCVCPTAWGTRSMGASGDQPFSLGTSSTDGHNAVHREPPALPVAKVRNRQYRARGRVGS